MFHTQTKTMSPLCAVTVTALSVVGGISLLMLAKKKMCKMKKEIKKFGCDCVDTMEDVMDDICTECDE